MRASRGWARRGGSGNRKEWGEVWGWISFVAIVSVNMGKEVAKLSSNLRKKRISLSGRIRRSLILAMFF